MRSFLTLLIAAVLLVGLPAPTQANEISQPEPCSADSRYVKNEMRAMWIASVVNIDWPSRAGLSVDRQKAELRSWLDLAERNNFNAVVLQVRPAADTFWPSEREPWSRWLTGRQGGDPGYDPLAFAVAEAHERDLELHAWFNPYRVTMGPSLTSLSPTHPARLNPDWVIRKDRKWYYDPGNPDARAHVVATIMEAVDRYDIDGVHFDDYFYPYPGSGRPFKDTATFRKYGTDYASRGDWRRANVDALIKDLSDRIRATKPWVQFGVSPFAVWRNQRTDPEGSDTRAGVQTYDQLYADTRKWVREGWIDYVAPQIYWTRGFEIADYERITRWWANEIDQAKARGHNVGLVIGEATYRAGTRTSPDWRKPNVLVRHRVFSRTIPQVRGAIYFSAKDVRADRRGTTRRLVKRFYSRPALPATFGSPTSPSPAAPVNPRRSDGVVRWNPGDANAVRYAIYQVPGAQLQQCDLIDARYLLGTVRAPNLTWQDPKTGSGTYVITAVDRWGRESAPAIAR